MAVQRGLMPDEEGEKKPQSARIQTDVTVKADAVFDQFVRLDRAVRSHADNVRARDRYLDGLFEALEGYLSSNGPLEVQLTARSFLMGGVPVCSGDGGEHITYRLFKYGIERMGFYPGIDRDELRKFFALVEEMDGGQQGPDLPSRLWHLGFRGLSVSAREEPWLAPGEGARNLLGQVAAPKDVQTRWASLVTPAPTEAELTDRSGLAHVAIADDGLKDRIRFEATYDPYVDFTRILLAIMAQETLEAVLQDCADVIEKLLDQLLDGWRHGDAVRVIEEARRFGREGKLAEAQQKAFSQLIAKLSSPDKIRKIVGTMQGGGRGSEAELSRYLRSLDAEAIPGILEGVQENHLDLFAEVVADLGASRLDLLIRTLGSPRALEVRCAIRALSRHRHRPALEEFRKLRSYPDPDVRIDAYLGCRKVVLDTDEDDADHAKMVLQDSDAKFKVKALQAIPADAFGAAEPLRRHIVDKPFYAETFDVKRELLRAYCRVAPAIAPDVYEEQFFSGWTWLRRGQEREDGRRLAAFALGELATDHAREVLTRQLESWNKTVREACRIALQKAPEGKESPEA